MDLGIWGGIKPSEANVWNKRESSAPLPPYTTLASEATPTHATLTRKGRLECPHTETLTIHPPQILTPRSTNTQSTWFYPYLPSYLHRVQWCQQLVYTLCHANQLPTLSYKVT